MSVAMLTRDIWLPGPFKQRGEGMLVAMRTNATKRRRKSRQCGGAASRLPTTLSIWLCEEFSEHGERTPSRRKQRLRRRSLPRLPGENELLLLFNAHGEVSSATQTTCLLSQISLLCRNWCVVSWPEDDSFALGLKPERRLQ